MAIFAVDPGRDKCGLVVASEDGSILEKLVVTSEEVVEYLQRLRQEYQLDVLLVGNGTGSQEFCRRLVEAHPELEQRVVMVDEYRTSEMARKRYVADHRRGWRRLLPVSLQTPDQPYDDYVAGILVERYIQERRSAEPQGEGTKK